MVLAMRYKGRNLKPGERVMKSSKIDLVLGDGKMSYEEEVQIDSTATTPVEETPVDEQ
jgi:hypothetical protein